jgi:hypothetical protein
MARRFHIEAECPFMSGAVAAIHFAALLIV